MQIGGKLPSADLSQLLSSGNNAKAKSGARKGVTNFSVTVKFMVTNAVYSLPGVHVPEGDAVHIRSLSGNAQDAFAMDYPGMLAAGQATPLAPGDDVLWPVENLAKIFVGGTGGDSVVVSIVTPAG